MVCSELREREEQVREANPGQRIRSCEVLQAFVRWGLLLILRISITPSPIHWT